MRRRLIVLATLALAVLAPGTAIAQSDLRLTGEADGHLAEGERVLVRVRIAGPGVRQVRLVDVALETNGRAVESIEVEPQQVAVGLGGEALESIFDDDPIRGAFFSLRPSSARIEIRGKELVITLPLRLLADPPAGSRLVATARAGVDRIGPVILGEPAAERGPFSLSSILLAGGVALVAGAAIGGATARRRRRSGPRVYDSVRNRLREEESTDLSAEPTPAASEAPTRSRPGKAPAKRSPTAKAPVKKAAARKAPAKKAAARKAPAKKAPTRRSRAT